MRRRTVFTAAAAAPGSDGGDEDDEDDDNGEEEEPSSDGEEGAAASEAGGGKKPLSDAGDGEEEYRLGEAKHNQEDDSGSEGLPPEDEEDEEGEGWDEEVEEHDVEADAFESKADSVAASERSADAASAAIAGDLETARAAEEAQNEDRDALVPTRGSFFMHDDRMGAGRRGRRPPPKEEEMQWMHDKFEELMREEPRPRPQRRQHERPHPPRSAVAAPSVAGPVGASHGRTTAAVHVQTRYNGSTLYGVSSSASSGPTRRSAPKRSTSARRPGKRRPPFEPMTAGAVGTGAILVQEDVEPGQAARCPPSIPPGNPYAGERQISAPASMPLEPSEIRLDRGSLSSDGVVGVSAPLRCESAPSAVESGNSVQQLRSKGPAIDQHRSDLRMPSVGSVNGESVGRVSTQPVESLQRTLSRPAHPAAVPPPSSGRVLHPDLSLNSSPATGLPTGIGHPSLVMPAVPPRPQQGLLRAPMCPAMLPLNTVGQPVPQGALIQGGVRVAPHQHPGIQGLQNAPQPPGAQSPHQSQRALTPTHQCGSGGFEVHLVQNGPPHTRGPMPYSSAPRPGLAIHGSHSPAYSTNAPPCYAVDNSGPMATQAAAGRPSRLENAMPRRLSAESAPFVSAIHDSPETQPGFEPSHGISPWQHRTQHRTQHLHPHMATTYSAVGGAYGSDIPHHMGMQYARAASAPLLCCSPASEFAHPCPPPADIADFCTMYSGRGGAVSRFQDPRFQEGRFQDGRFQDSRFQDGRFQDARFGVSEQPDLHLMHHGGGQLYTGGLFTPQHAAAMAHREHGTSASRPSLELEGYSLNTTHSGLSVLVPTGNRKITIQRPPDSPPARSTGPAARAADAQAAPPSAGGHMASREADLPPGLAIAHP